MHGSVFLPGVTDRAMAEISAGSEGLRARLADGADVAARWGELTASVGGHDRQMLFLRTTAGLCFCLDASHVEALRAAAGRSHAALLADLGRQSGAVRARFGLAVAGVVAVFVLVVGGVALGLPWAAGRVVAELPAEVDRTIGDASYEQMDLGGPKVDDPVLDQALRVMLERLVPPTTAPRFDYRIQVVRSDQVNAFALPGGRIVVYTGLLAKATRPEQVAGVLAHEIAHVTHRHGLAGLAKQVGVVVGLQLLLGDASGLAGLAGQGAMTAVLNGYSREAEREADAEGLRLLMAAQIDPHGLGEFFQVLKGEAGSEAPGLLAVLSTHPDHDERIATLTAAIAAAPPVSVVPLAIDWAAVQAAAK